MSHKQKINITNLKKKNPRKQNPCHSLFSGGIICGSHRGSFAVRDHLRSNLGIISGLGIICRQGSFAALYRPEDFESQFSAIPGTSFVGLRSLKKYAFFLIGTSEWHTATGLVNFVYYPTGFL